MAINIRIPIPPPQGNKDDGVWTGWFNSIHDAFARLGEAIHNSLGNLQGGTTNEYYHLTSTQHTDLTDGTSSSLHYHNSDRDSANFSGTDWDDLTDGGTTTLHKHTISASATLDFPSVASNGIASLTITVTGATAGNPVILGPPAAIEAGLTWSGYVSAANTVTVRVHNNTGGAVDPASAIWTVAVHL